MFEATGRRSSWVVPLALALTVGVGGLVAFQLRPAAAPPEPELVEAPDRGVIGDRLHADPAVQRCFAEEAAPGDPQQRVRFVLTLDRGGGVQAASFEAGDGQDALERCVMVAVSGMRFPEEVPRKFGYRSTLGEWVNW